MWNSICDRNEALRIITAVYYMKQGMIFKLWGSRLDQTIYCVTAAMLSFDGTNEMDILVLHV